jgi:hypothetical protein
MRGELVTLTLLRANKPTPCNLADPQRHVALGFVVNDVLEQRPQPLDLGAEFADSAAIYGTMLKPLSCSALITTRGRPFVSHMGS